MKALGWLAFGGAALYLADKMGYLNGVTGVLGNVTGVSPGTTVQQQPVGSAQANNPTSPITDSTLTSMIQLMQQYNQDPMKNQFSAWVYNTYYKLLRGKEAPDPFIMFPGRPNLANETMTINQWWSAMTGNGFSGMGIIAHHVNPYLQGPRYDPRKMFGAGLQPNGMETYLIVKGQG